MFHLDDNAVTEQLLSIFQDAARIDEQDGYIWFVGDKHNAERDAHNVCEILLSWEIEEEYGVQRIRHGSEEPKTRAQWRKKLYDGLLASRVAERMDEVKAVFPDTKIKFVIIGWHMLTVQFRRLGRNDRVLCPLPAAQVTNGPTDNDAGMAKKTDAN